MRVLTTACLVLGGLGVHARLDDFYCGTRTCYEVLGIENMDKPKTISKKYDQAVKENNGDNSTVPLTVPTPEDLESQYLMINKACETLINVESRKTYDDLLADPFRYKIMKRKYYGGGQNIYVNPVIAFGLFLAIGTAAQLYLRKQHVALQRNEVIMKALISAAFQDIITKRVNESSKKAELIQLREKNDPKFLEQVKILCAADIAKVDFGDLDSADIELMDMFFVRVLMLPYTLPVFVVKALTGTRKDKRAAMSARDKTAKAFGLTPAQFNAATDKNGFAFTGGQQGLSYLGDADELVALKLWNKANMKAWRDSRTDAQLAEVPKNQRKRVLRDKQQQEKAAANLARRHKLVKLGSDKQ